MNMGAVVYGGKSINQDMDNQNLGDIHSFLAVRP